MLSVTYKPFMLSVIMLNVILLSVIKLSVIMLNVVILSAIMLSAIMLSVIMLSDIRLSVVAPNEMLKCIETSAKFFANENIRKKNLKENFIFCENVANLENVLTCFGQTNRAALLVWPWSF
jgi:hypothetical protein